MTNFSAKFNLHQHVIVDGDQSMPAVITAIEFNDGGARYELCWFSHGEHHRSWIEEFRCSLPEVA